MGSYINYTSNSNVTRHRNGQSVKSRQTRWEWQLLISIMHIHDVVTRYSNCAFLCAWHDSLPYHHVVLMRVTLMIVCVPKMYCMVDDHVNFNHRLKR